MAEKASPLRINRALMGTHLLGIYHGLEGYEFFDEDYSKFAGTDKSVQKGAQYAIRNVRQLSRGISEAEEIADKLPDSPIVHAAKVVLAFVRNTLGQCDVPALDALNDGHEEIATRLVIDSVFKAWEKCGLTLENLAAEFQVAASAPDTIIDADDADDTSTATKPGLAVARKPEVPGASGRSDQDKSRGENTFTLTEHETWVISTMARFDSSVLMTAPTISIKMKSTQRLSERTVRDIVRKLVKIGLAERPEGNRKGCRLTTKGRLHSPKIAA